MPAAKKPAKRPMSDSHKAALAAGREQGRAVRNYLEALEAHKPKRGRKRTPESIDRQLTRIDEKLAGADPLTRLNLTQQRIDLLSEKEALGAAVDLSELEDGFVKSAKEYGARKGISYAAWRATGVPADILKKAGIGRGD